MYYRMREPDSSIRTSRVLRLEARGGGVRPRKLERFSYLLSTLDVILCGEGGCLR